MKLLAIDTSTEACSAALYLDGQVRQRYAMTPGGHGRHILAMVQSLLQEAGMPLNAMDALAFGRGPGGFTGVRMATGVIQGLALGLDIPVVPVSSLAALAQGAVAGGSAEAVLAAIDARMNEVYWAAYRLAEGGVVALQGEERVNDVEGVTLPAGGAWWGIGSGWRIYGERLSERFGHRLSGYSADRYPRAADIVALAVHDYRLGRAVPVDQVTPVYLRDRVVHKPGFIPGAPGSWTRRRPR